MRKTLLTTALTLTLLTTPTHAGELLKTADETVPGRYLVVLRDGVEAAASADSLAAAHGGVVTTTYQHALNGFVVDKLDEKTAEALAKDPRVHSVAPDAIFHTNATQVYPPWGLDRIDDANLPLDSSYDYDFTGFLTNVYVLDTGLRATHTDFGGRAYTTLDAVDHRDATDCNGHGTHVAGTIGGATYGVAKAPRVWGVKVCDCTGSCPLTSIVEGIDWVIANAQRPAIVNMSLGGGGNTTLDAAVQRGLNAGILFVVAAGNESTDACTRSPARVPGALTVGATDAWDYQAWFSNYGSCVDLYAPGVSVLSAGIGSDTDTDVLSGTSMASPHVAGAAAVIWQENLNRTPAQVIDTLKARSVTGRILGIGAGSPNLLLQTRFAPLGTPAALSVYPNACYGSNDADWSAVAGATRYELYASTTNTFTSQTLLYNGANTSLSFNVTGTRYLRVRACNTQGCGPYRNGNRTATYTNGCL